MLIMNSTALGINWKCDKSKGREAMKMERVYKTMRNTGAGCIAIGIIMAVAGLTAGIISIVNGALLLKRKSEIEF